MAIKFKGNEQQTLALETFVKLVRASNSVSSSCTSVMASQNLTETQFGVLESLYHLGPMSQKQLSEKLLKSGGNITMVIDNLSRNGLVVRQKRDEDRRFYWISLTETGKNLIERIFPDHAVKITERLSVLSPEEQRLLGKLCRKLGLNKGENQ